MLSAAPPPQPGAVPTVLLWQMTRLKYRVAEQLPRVPAPSSPDASKQQPRPGHSRCELSVGTVFLDDHF